MGRIPRGLLFYNGCYAHVYSRSLEKRKIINSEDDFQFLKKQIIETKKEYSFKVFHYCLMQTHFHLVVEVCDVERFSIGMQVLKKAYTHRFNTKNNRFGAIWRDRYGSKLIEDENYLYVCGKYVENNPVEAGLVNVAVDWPHSSCRHYFLGEEDGVVDCYDVNSIDKNLRVDFKEGYVKGWGSDWFQYQLNKQLKG